MDQIRPWLFIGGVRDTLNSSYLSFKSISAMLQLAAKVENLSLFDAFKEIKIKYPEALPHEPVWASLCRYYNESVPYLDVVRVKVTP